MENLVLRFFYDPVQRVLRGHKFVYNSLLMQNTLKVKYCQPNVIVALHVTYTEYTDS